MKTAILPSFHRIAPAAPRPAAAPPSLSETTAAEILRRRGELKEHREDLARAYTAEISTATILRNPWTR